MDDEWDDASEIVAPPPPQTNNCNNDRSEVDEGHSLSRGRGFQSFQEDFNDFTKDVGSNGYGERRGHGGRGGGRGRGGRGGRGGGRDRDRGDFDTNGDSYEDEGERGDRGERGERGRGRGRGGRSSADGEHGADGPDDEKKAPVTYVPPEPTENEQEIFSSTISSGINFDKFDCILLK